MDDYPEFYSGRARRLCMNTERAIVRTVHTVVTSSTGLWNKFADASARRVMLRNGFSMTGLPPLGPRDTSAPAVFGYVGCISQWFDWSFVLNLAHTLPQARVRLVGPVHGRVPALPPNVELCPPCSHVDAIAHLRRFSVGIIPFVDTALTRAVDPIKYYAYRAMGLPIISTRFGDMRLSDRRQGVFFASSHQDFHDAALALTHSTITPTDVAAFRETHDWSRRFEDAQFFSRVLPL
jgi:hypothetical protein